MPKCHLPTYRIWGRYMCCWIAAPFCGCSYSCSDNLLIAAPELPFTVVPMADWINANASESEAAWIAENFLNYCLYNCPNSCRSKSHTWAPLITTSTLYSYVDNFPKSCPCNNLNSCMTAFGESILDLLPIVEILNSIYCTHTGAVAVHSYIGLGSYLCVITSTLPAH